MINCMFDKIVCYYSKNYFTQRHVVIGNIDTGNIGMSTFHQNT